MDIGDIQASSRKAIGAISKTPTENRGQLLRHRSAPSSQVPEPRASYSRKKTNARVFFFVPQFFSIHSSGTSIFLSHPVDASPKTDQQRPAVCVWMRPAKFVLFKLRIQLDGRTRVQTFTSGFDSPRGFAVVRERGSTRPSTRRRASLQSGAPWNEKTWVQIYEECRKLPSGTA
jgi:hypothetical protein